MHGDINYGWCRLLVYKKLRHRFIERHVTSSDKGHRQLDIAKLGNWFPSALFVGFGQGFSEALGELTLLKAGHIPTFSVKVPAIPIKIDIARVPVSIPVHEKSA